MTAVEDDKVHGGSFDLRVDSCLALFYKLGLLTSSWQQHHKTVSFHAQLLLSFCCTAGALHNDAVHPSVCSSVTCAAQRQPCCVAADCYKAAANKGVPCFFPHEKLSTVKIMVAVELTHGIRKCATPATINTGVLMPHSMSVNMFCRSLFQILELEKGLSLIFEL